MNSELKTGENIIWKYEQINLNSIEIKNNLKLAISLNTLC